MPLPRIQAFEFNDREWAPAFLRDTIVEALSLTLRWGGIMDGLAPHFHRFLSEAGTTEVLDLGSGAGGPGAALTDALAARGAPVRFLLTDLFPRVAVWSELASTRPGALEIVEQPVDATNIPRELSAGRARVVLNVLHHFPAPLARSVLADAVSSRAPIFIAEGFERNPLGFVAFAPAGIPALAATPLLAKNHRFARAMITWATPIALLASMWDGFVSTLRVYTEGELREMVRDLDGSEGWTWSYGTYAFPPFGRGYFFHGLPPR